MRVRSVVLIVVSVMLLAFAIGCTQQQTPPPAATGVPDGIGLLERPALPAHTGKTASGGCTAKVRVQSAETASVAIHFPACLIDSSLLVRSVSPARGGTGKHTPARQTKSNPDSCHHTKGGAFQAGRERIHETVESPGAGEYHGRYSIPVKEEVGNARSLRGPECRVRNAARLRRRLRQAGTPQARGSGGSRGGGPGGSRGGRQDPLRQRSAASATASTGRRCARETKEKWASIVKEMQGKKADWISDAEAAKIVDYLAAEHGKK